MDALVATNVYLRPHLLQEVAGTVYGPENVPVTFASSHPASASLGHYWSGLSRLATDTVDSGAFDAPSCDPPSPGTWPWRCSSASP